VINEYEPLEEIGENADDVKRKKKAKIFECDEVLI